nr:hypothetical protein CFP56_01880 [Quercus suber]POE93904.1 hypothetical protein CFP56_26938 [Quercus suber]
MIRDQSISEDDIGGTKLTVFMKEDLRPLDSVKVLMVHQVKVGSSEIFICSRLEKGSVGGETPLQKKKETEYMFL